VVERGEDTALQVVALRARPEHHVVAALARQQVTMSSGGLASAERMTADRRARCAKPPGTLCEPKFRDRRTTRTRRSLCAAPAGARRAVGRAVVDEDQLDVTVRARPRPRRGGVELVEVSASLNTGTTTRGVARTDSRAGLGDGVDHPILLGMRESG